jgi:hypothetical protein
MRRVSNSLAEAERSDIHSPDKRKHAVVEGLVIRAKHVDETLKGLLHGQRLGERVCGCCQRKC